MSYLKTRQKWISRAIGMCLVQTIAVVFSASVSHAAQAPASLPGTQSAQESSPGAGVALKAQPADLSFPKQVSLPSGTLIVHEPQIESAPEYKQIFARAAVVYQSSSGGAAQYGTVQYRADLTADKNLRSVTFFNREITDVRFPDMSSTAAKPLIDEVTHSVKTTPVSMPLDVLLAYVSDQATDVPSVSVSREAPEIFYSDKPAIFVVLDGPPIARDVKGSDGLKVVVNTNWDLFQGGSDDAYFLLVDKAWFKARSLDGPWAASSSPPGINALPDDTRWDRVRAAGSGTAINGTIPKIITAKAPAELIVTDGPPSAGMFGTSGLSFITNTSSDIVYDTKSYRYYYLTSGRWFVADGLTGPWQSLDKAPETFAEIPADHARAHVRASVAGTTESKLAIIQSQIPQTAAVSRATKPEAVLYAGGKPTFSKIEGTNVERATNTTSDVLRVDGVYYLCVDAIWFVSPLPDGPWTVAERVPEDIYTIPSSSPVHHVTYVRHYDTQPDYIYYGYTPGYHHSYVSYGVVVYGAGYYWGSYYDPFYYSHYPYWHYYRYPHSYGYASYYNPMRGGYVHGHYAYGPYGGYWGSSHYNPRNGRYGQGVRAWDYNDVAYSGWSHNPRTDVTIGTNQRIHWNDSDSYQSWGETVVQRNDKWVSSERYGTERGFRRDIETSEGGRGVQLANENRRGAAFKSADGDVYAGTDGKVFRHTDQNGWQMRDSGSWSTLDRGTVSSTVQGRRDDLGSSDRPVRTQDRSDGFEPVRLPNRQTSTSSRNRSSSQYNRSNLERSRTARNSGRQNYNSYRSRSSSMGSRGGRGRRR